MKVRTCKYYLCSKEFVQEHKNQLYCCPECRTIANRERSAEYDRERRAAKRREKTKKVTLRDINKKAKEHGMSYGQYVAMMEGGMI